MRTTTTTISDLPEDVLLEILFKVPLASLKPMRFTCKKWNALSKTHIIGKARKQMTFITLMSFRFFSMELDIQEIRGDDFVDPISLKQISFFNQKISKIVHCDGLLLCIRGDGLFLLVWNPYLGQTRYINKSYIYGEDVFALGYEKNNGSHKILRILMNGRFDTKPKSFEIYDFRSNSWRVIDVNPVRDIYFCRNINIVSLKGNTYFFVREKRKCFQTSEELKYFLLCFDFTAERFGPRLSLPYQNTFPKLFVKDEQLALLYEVHDDTTWMLIDMEIWVTNKIESDVVLWSKFWKMDKKQFVGFPDDFGADWFFIDEEMKTVVIFGYSNSSDYETAYIVGTDGYFKSTKIENPQKKQLISTYVPSLVQL